MKLLSEALGVRQGDVVSFVGAGGKTTSMMRLASELASQGRGVVVATTTHIHEPVLSEVRAILLEPDLDRLLATLPQLLKRYRLVGVGPKVTAVDPSDGYRKLAGLPPDCIDKIAALPGVDNVLVEADGARGRSLKAPANHEPVVPRATTLLVPLAGADVVGQPLDAARVHRPELVSRLGGLAEAATLTPSVVAEVLAHPLGGVKGCPALARVVPIINKAGSPVLLQRGLAVAFRLAELDRVDRVVVGAMADRTADLAVVEGTRSRRLRSHGAVCVAAIILAAGAGRRFGGCKQLAIIDGEPMVVRVTRAVMESAADACVVVLGCQAEEVAQALASLGVPTIVNDEWGEGIGSSLRCGLAKVGPVADAVLFILADQASLTSAEIDAVISAYRSAPGRPGAGWIVVPVHKGRRGHPVLFDSKFFGELFESSGDDGGRQVLARHLASVLQVPVASGGVVADVDYRSDLSAAGTIGLNSDG